MRTNFSLAQLADPQLAEAEKNLRACVHCGICTATCPTYVLLGDERDSPRGRIVMMQRMLEEGGAPSPETVLHVDRCLSCLGCRTACPSSVDYARLVDQARAHIETHHRRPLDEQLTRWFIATVLTRPAIARAGITLAKIFTPIAKRLPGKLGAMALKAMTMRSGKSQAAIPETDSNAPRIALMPGCVQAALAPQIDEAAARVLARRGLSLTPLEGAGCCGALAHHLGRSAEAKAWARRAIAAFERGGDFEAVLISATGCAAHLQDYPHLFADEPEWKMRAAAFAARVKDFSLLASPRAANPPRRLRVAYQQACSLQNGLRLLGQGEALIAAAGHEVLAIPESHLCCGSAGSYSILQPEIAEALRERKLENIRSVKPDIVVSGNIGCMSHLSGEGGPPILHLAELLDWSEGGLAENSISR
ncbi:MAG TPA: glycolate oxidase subunit GlcF [Rhizomicrobium sp.]|nr:glycolate oxidase subunit GlcF [Rhizomicrobium sp.]